MVNMNRMINYFLRVVAIAAALEVSSSIYAQDFMGSFAPATTQKQTQSKPIKKKGSVRKVSLPDKPNITDENGLKQGQWAKKYANGQYRYTANFKDGKPVGKLTRFDSDGRKTAVLTYKESSDTVKAIFYHPNGKIQARGQYVGNMREGLWRIYAEDGVLIESAIYSKNKLHGKRCFYFENGNLLSVCSWVDSLREGPYIKYFPSGAKEIEANFHGDELDGKYRSWGADGKITSEGIYKSGVTIGKWHLRYPDANIEGDIIYDSHGLIVNTDEADSLMMRRNSFYSRKIGQYKDPQDYIDNPEGYILN